MEILTPNVTQNKQQSSIQKKKKKKRVGKEKNKNNLKVRPTATGKLELDKHQKEVSTSSK